ncbi:RpiR family carbohydrate utilization transcriptional regulator [Kitasatospora sp. GAS204A]|uniref:MurR/RpiR family transcriptional regulator n=1 Tax=unclassified Kitasatospora TaxID=2633591 RepID=UPI002474307E|nr:MurR/RpiR family transcriptional regulator [Kitasatospora sp. GAS204B]MDH6120389.1 RpiR family carbohydrate utilization transcriptional regulator [Kitasatospora sp. GAS204B]
MESSSVNDGQLAAHIRAHLPELRDAEARVAQVVLDQGAELASLTIGDVAALAGTAPSSVVRACQRLGFRGFQQLKLAAARQAPRPAAGQHPASQDPAARALADTLRAAREALDGLTATLDPTGLRAAAELLDAASRVLVIGAGLSGAVALDAAYRLRALGCAVDAPADPSTAQLAAGLLPPSAVCLAISHTGATRTTVDAARLARDAGADVIALTSTAHSPLGELSSRTLVAGGQDLILGLETVASRLAHLAVIDALALTLLTLRGASAEQALFLSAGITADHLY